MKKLLLCFIVAQAFVNHCNAQLYFQYWDKTYGGNKGDNVGGVIYLNNEIWIAGSTTTRINGDKTLDLCPPPIGFNTDYPDVWYVSIDLLGNIISDKSIGGNKVEVRSSLKLIDNNILISAQSSSDSSCHKSENNRNPNPSQVGSVDYWIYLMDTTGVKIWDKTYGTVQGDGDPTAIKITTNDFIVAGTTSGGISGDKTVANYGGSDFWVLKLDSLGNKIWDKVYGGTMSEQTVSNQSTIVKPLNQGDFILAGSTNSPVSGSISDTSRGLFDFWVIKLDSSGTKIWDKRYGGSAADWLYDLNSTEDGGFIICGSTSSPVSGEVSEPSKGAYDFWVIKTDSLGNKLWDKRYGGANEERAVKIKAAPEGGYWVAGYTISNAGMDISEASFGGYDYWIIKIDEQGNKLWDKRFGGQANDLLYDFIILPDSSLLLVGTSDSSSFTTTKTAPSKGMGDYWAVRIKYSDTTTSVNYFTYENYSLNIFPNPSTGEVNISFTLKEEMEIKIELYNSLGQLVKAISQQKFTAGKNHINFSTENLSKGIYHIKFSVGDDVVTRKLVKM